MAVSDIKKSIEVDGDKPLFEFISKNKESYVGDRVGVPFTDLINFNADNLPKKEEPAAGGHGHGGGMGMDY
jgi:hypothetical protein